MNRSILALNLLAMTLPDARYASKVLANEPKEKGKPMYPFPTLILIETDTPESDKIAEAFIGNDCKEVTNHGFDFVYGREGVICNNAKAVEFAIKHGVPCIVVTGVGTFNQSELCAIGNANDYTIVYANVNDAL